MNNIWFSKQINIFLLNLIRTINKTSAISSWHWNAEKIISDKVTRKIDVRNKNKESSKETSRSSTINFSILLKSKLSFVIYHRLSSKYG